MRRLKLACGAVLLLGVPVTLAAAQVIALAGRGQPEFVSAPVHWVSTVIAAHPVVWSVPFAALQLLLGIGLLVRRTARLALAASVAWALGWGTSARASPGWRAATRP